MIKIIWIEDESENFIDLKNRISGSIRNLYITLIDTKTLAAHDFNEINYDYMILDYRYKEGGDAKAVLRNIRQLKNVPFIVYSNFIDEIDDEIKNDKNLIEIIPKNKSDDLLTTIKKIVDYIPITVCHLSDIHYPSDISSRDRDDKYSDFFENYLKGVDHLIMTGDFANKFPNIDLSELERMIKPKLIHQYGEEYFKNISIIPGNHDILWDSYEKNVLNEKCFNKYFLFYTKLIKNHNFTEEKILKSIDEGVTNIDTCWAKEINNNISMIGINSSITDAKMKGKGVFTSEHKKLIIEYWKKEKRKGEIRIVLVHHNLFTPLSLSTQEEKNQIYDNGIFISVLLEKGVDIVLSGHTHSPNVIEFSGASFNSTETRFYKQPRFLNISSGTFGGYGPQYQSPNFFNILNFRPKIVHNEQFEKDILWELQIIPHQFNNTTLTWNPAREVLTYIL